MNTFQYPIDATGTEAFALAGGNFLTGPEEDQSNLAERTMVTLKRTFAERGHSPTPEMWNALREVANTMDQMANGTADLAVHLSSLDPGVGKTSVVIHFIRTLLQSTEHSSTSVLLCVARREQITAIVEEAGLDEGDFAVLTSDKALNGLGCSNGNHARILFTTHSMIESRCSERKFLDAGAFHYRGRAREIRIWDEAILPGKTMTVSRDDIATLLKPLRFSRPALAADIEELFVLLGKAEDGALLPLPDLSVRYGLSLNGALALLPHDSAEQTAVTEALWFLFGKTVTVRRDGKYGNTILDYRETLPDDLKPVLVLDASARVRTTYDLWKDRRGKLVLLSPASKRYERHTVHVWNHAGGKSAFREGGAAVIDGIADTIRKKLSEEWLVVHHQNCGLDVPQAIQDRLPTHARVHFLHWGRHDATNDFAHVANVILAGTLFYRTSRYEALGRMAAGQPSAHGAFPLKDTQEVIQGENRNVVLQALCRGAVRRCEADGGCPDTHSYVIASNRSGIAQALPKILPGARVLSWRPVPVNLSGKVKKAIEYIKAQLAEDPPALITFHQVERHLECRDRSNFNRTIRRNKKFVEALADEGLTEWGEGRRPTGFCNGNRIFGEPERS